MQILVARLLHWLARKVHFGYPFHSHRSLTAESRRDAHFLWITLPPALPVRVLHLSRLISSSKSRSSKRFKGFQSISKENIFCIQKIFRPPHLFPSSRPSRGPLDIQSGKS
jgi:hypothetical protein